MEELLITIRGSVGHDPKVEGFRPGYCTRQKHLAPQCKLGMVGSKKVERAPIGKAAPRPVFPPCGDELLDTQFIKP